MPPLLRHLPLLPMLPCSSPAPSNSMQASPHAASSLLAGQTLILEYTYGINAFEPNVNRTGVIQFDPQGRWRAYFADRPHDVFCGSYTTFVNQFPNEIVVHIVHDGDSSDGKDNRLVLQSFSGSRLAPGAFRETSNLNPMSSARGPYRFAERH